MFSVAALANIFKIADLRKKVMITLALMFIYRIGCFVPTPGVDTFALSQFFNRIAQAQSQSLLGMMNLFTGGALTRLSIFALGVMPYISASIIMQLLTAVIPALEKIAKEGKAGYEKINQYTRYLTFFLCIMEGLFLSLWLENPASFEGITIVPDPGWAFRITTILTLGCGTIFVMWLGEQIQERGIGNGVSLLIATGIISRIPSAFSQLWELWAPFDSTKRQIQTPVIIMLVLLWVAVIMGVILFSQAQRRLPVQYGRRVVGRKVYGGQSTYLPIKVDMAGVIAIIFAQSVMMFPATIATFMPKLPSFMGWIQAMLQERNIWYSIILVVLLFFFMYFYTALVFNPLEISNNLKRYGGFIPGIRPGRPTAEHLDYVATRIVFVGSAYICVIAVCPTLIMHIFSVPSYSIASFFGGTTILIMVGVVLDTMKQIEGQLTVRHYEGFMKEGALKGRR